MANYYQKRDKMVMNAIVFCKSHGNGHVHGHVHGHGNGNGHGNG